MKNGSAGFTMLAGALCLVALVISGVGRAKEKAAVSLILKNNSSSPVEVALIDQYGGNFTATIDAGMGQNQTLKVKSPIKIGDAVVYVVVPEDEGKEVIIAGE